MYRTDPELATAVERYVDTAAAPERRYRTLLHGQFAFRPEAERTPFLRSMADDARRITDRELWLLLGHDWRARLTAAWLIGIARREPFRPELSRLLLASELTYAGQGYCLALATFGTDADADVLAAYLHRYLTARPRVDHDQPWALGALLHLDEHAGSDRAGQFLAPGGPWHEWSAGRWDATTEKQRIGQLRDLIAKAA